MEALLMEVVVCALPCCDKSKSSFAAVVALPRRDCWSLRPPPPAEEDRRLLPQLRLSDSDSDAMEWSSNSEATKDSLSSPSSNGG